LESDEPTQPAQRHPLTEQSLREQLGRLGGTPFELGDLRAQVSGTPMLPFIVLGKLRHALVEQLEAAVVAVPPRRIAHQSALANLRSALPGPDEPGSRAAGERQIHVLCRSLAQLREVLGQGVRSLYADFQDIREYRAAVASAREQGATLFLATPRIQKPKELGIFHALLKQRPDGVLVRNLGGLRFFADQGLPLVADFSLNCANELTAAYLKEFGAVRITPSYDLNREQLLELVGAAPASWLEVVVHQHMPMFHMEHCVFCAMLSPGTNKTNCGRPCDRHEVKLRDRLGMEHPLQADVGCRNTLFNAVPQSAAEAIPALLERGVQHYRLEMLHDEGNSLRQVLDLYRSLLAGEVTGKEVWSRLKATNRVGVTRGTLEERRNPLAIL
jgi:putative protease